MEEINMIEIFKNINNLTKNFLDKADKFIKQQKEIQKCKSQKS